VDEDDINDLIGTLSKDSKIDDNMLNKAMSGIKEAIGKIKEAFPEATTEQFKSASGAAIRQLAKDLSAENPDIKKAIATFAGNMQSSLAKAIGEVAVNVFGPEFTQKIGKGAVEAKSALSGAVKVIAEGAKIELPVGFDITDMSSLKGLLEGAGEVGGRFALGMGIDKQLKNVEAFNSGFKALRGNLDSYAASAAEISKIQINPFSSPEDVANSANSSGREGASEFRAAFEKEVINLRSRLSLSPSEANADLKAVYSRLENYGAQLGGIEINAKIEGTDTVISGAEAIAMAARATGIDISTMTDTFNKLTFTMNADSKQAVQSIETIAKAAANTLLPVSKFHAEVMTAAGQFELFGDNTEEAAAMLDRFISKAEPNRIGASVQAFQKVAAGIAQMSDQMKAFIGMGTELAGGGGAIESIVRLDAALQSGDKDALQGIFDEAIARIEELSGAPVMTLQEAVASGQEQTFYQQVKMLEEMNLSKGSAQASDIFAASKRGAIDVETIRAQGGPGLGQMAVEKSRMGKSAGEIAEAQLGAAADLARFNASYSDGAVKVMDISDRLGDGLSALGNRVAGAESALKALALFGFDTEVVKTKGLVSAKAEAEDAARAANTATAREGRTATEGAQGLSAREEKFSLLTSQSTVAEELTTTGAAIAILTQQINGAISTLNSAGGGPTLDTAKLEVTVAELSNAVDKIQNQKIQIEFTGEGKTWFKGEAAVAASRAVRDSSSVP
jgi:hypothetical protein